MFRRPVLSAITCAARALLLGGAMLAAPAYAAGTVAGTTISNTATATYQDAQGNAVTVPSNRLDLKVDEILNVIVANTSGGDVSVTPGATNRVLRFSVTNAGNGPEAFALTAINAIGGDQFDPTTTQIIIDTNANGSYDPGVDTVYSAGAEPSLTPDSTLDLLVLSTIPAGATDTQRGATDLRAAAKTGTGTAGTTFAGQGFGGGDAIVGLTSATADARGFYLVSATSVAFVKTASVLDPFGGSRVVPGSIVTYTLTATVNGSGSLPALTVGDPIPAATAYQPGTLTLGGTALTDGVDGDAGEVAGGAIAVRLGTVAGGSTRTVSFKVKVN